MEQSQGTLQRIDHRLPGCGRSFRRALVHSDLTGLDVPVAVFRPDEVIETLAGLAELDGELERVIDTLVSQGLLVRDEGNGEERLRRPAPQTPEAIQLWVLAQCSIQTLERFYMTAALLAKHGSGTLRPGQLEDLCHLMAQRMSMLFQFSAPEFFDKTLFRGFIGRLRKNGVLRTDESGLLVFDAGLLRAMEDARVFLGDRLRRDVLQAMNL